MADYSHICPCSKVKYDFATDEPYCDIISINECPVVQVEEANNA